MRCGAAVAAAGVSGERLAWAMERLPVTPSVWAQTSRDPLLSSAGGSGSHGPQPGNASDPLLRAAEKAANATPTFLSTIVHIWTRSVCVH